MLCGLGRGGCSLFNQHGAGTSSMGMCRDACLVGTLARLWWLLAAVVDWLLIGSGLVAEVRHIKDYNKNSIITFRWFGQLPSMRYLIPGFTSQE